MRRSLLDVPVCLETGAERDRVVGEGAQRMRHIADKLEREFPSG